jgi:hypothetical protein
MAEQNNVKTSEEEEKKQTYTEVSITILPDFL